MGLHTRVHAAAKARYDCWCRQSSIRKEVGLILATSIWLHVAASKNLLLPLCPYFLCRPTVPVCRPAVPAGHVPVAPVVSFLREIEEKYRFWVSGRRKHTVKWWYRLPGLGKHNVKSTFGVSGYPKHIVKPSFGFSRSRKHHVKSTFGFSGLRKHNVKSTFGSSGLQLLGDSLSKK